MDWATLTTLPSRYSTEALHRDERQQRLNDVATPGYSDNYGGIRVSATGRRFYIDPARIWMLLDARRYPRRSNGDLREVGTALTLLKT